MIAIRGRGGRAGGKQINVEVSDDTNGKYIQTDLSY